jgi:coiled-coil domain-containing protein 115
MLNGKGSDASAGLREENAEGIHADADGMKEEIDTDAELQDEGKGRKKPKNPIRMFGILTPQALRLAQGGAIKMVEEIVPKLVEVDIEMKEVEIKIRRARKYRAKAEAAEKGGEKTVGAESREEGVVS